MDTRPFLLGVELIAWRKADSTASSSAVSIGFAARMWSTCAFSNLDLKSASPFEPAAVLAGGAAAAPPAEPPP